MERTALLPHIKQTSYMKKLHKIFTTIKDTLKLTRFCVLLINQTIDVKHNWKSQGNSRSAGRNQTLRSDRQIRQCIVHFNGRSLEFSQNKGI